MNADLLLDYYDRIADAPDAVAQLRRFVLDLAVRGKLVPQESNDEPASELLRRIAAEKARLVKLGKIKRQDPLLPIQDEDIPSHLPKTWSWVQIGDIFDYDAGIKRDPKELDPQKWLLELEDIEKDTSAILNRLRVKDRDSLSTKSEFEVGDILYGKLRPYLNKVVVANEAGYSTTEIVAIRPFLPLCSEYCAIALRRPDFVEYVTRLGQGTKMPRLRTPDAIVAPFPLPPLAEQRRIVARVDELMALCDELEWARAEREARRDRLAAATWARLSAPNDDRERFRDDAAFALKQLAALTARPEQVKALRQTILNLAVRGRLVAQDAGDEPASELLRKVAKEKALLLGKASIRESQVDGKSGSESFEFPLPSGWELSTLGEVSLKITDGTHKTPTYVSAGVPFVSVKDFSSGHLSLSHTRFITRQEHDILYKRCDPKRGDILIGRIGTLGRAVLVDTDDIFSLFVSVGLIRFSHNYFDPHFFRILLNSPIVESEYDRIKVGGGTHTNKLNLGDLHTVKMLIPPLAEQRRIVAKVDELMALCDALEASLAAGGELRRRLLEAVLHGAVAG